MTDEPANSHVMPMLALHIAGLLMSVMGAVTLYATIFHGLRVRERNTGVYWTLLETLLLEVGLLAVGVLAAWWGQRQRSH